jgi:hypothetical protein
MLWFKKKEHACKFKHYKTDVTHYHVLDFEKCKCGKMRVIKTGYQRSNSSEVIIEHLN